MSTPHLINKQLASKLDITSTKLNLLCNRHYAIWFLREVYIYGQLSSDRKGLIFEALYTVITKKCFKNITELYVLMPEVSMADWLFAFHVNYYTRSPHYIRSSNYVD